MRHDYSVEQQIDPLQQAYADHLQAYPWDFFSTVTFRKLHRDPINAAAKVCRALERLDCTRAFVAVERHRLDGVHVHTLHRHAFDPGISSTRVWKYFHKAFGFSTVSPPRADDTVALYCSKYVTKDNGLHGESFYYFGDKEAWLFDGHNVPVIT